MFLDVAFAPEEAPINHMDHRRRETVGTGESVIQSSDLRFSHPHTGSGAAQHHHSLSLHPIFICVLWEVGTARAAAGLLSIRKCQVVTPQEDLWPPLLPLLR